MATTEPKLKEIAARIYAKLKQFAADPKVNKRNGGVARFWMVNAYDAGRFVGVIYVSYQGPSMLKKQQALAYMEWLEAGNVGTHYEFEQAAKGQPGERTESK